MRYVVLSAVSGLLFAAPFGAMADEPDYTYIEGRYYINGELTDTNSSRSTEDEEDYDGFEIGGSYGITRYVFLTVGFSKLEEDDDTELSGEVDNAELERTSLGVGVAAPLGSKSHPLDFFGVFSFEDIDEPENDAPGAVDANGFGLTAGMRWQPLSWFEFAPYVTYIDYGTLENLGLEFKSLRYGAKAVASISDSFAVTASYRTSELDFSGRGITAETNLEDEIGIGARFYFGGGTAEE